MDTIYRFTHDDRSGQDLVETAWQGALTRPSEQPGYTDVCATVIGTQCCLAALCPEQRAIDLFQIHSDGDGVQWRTSFQATADYTMIRALSVGGKPHLLAYDSTTGQMDFFTVGNEFELDHVYGYARSYGPSTIGLTTLEAYQYRGEMLVLGYNINSGDVAVYQLNVTADAPLNMVDVWQSKLSPGWTRFTLFKLGQENFFLKSNIKHQTVYIDHFESDPSKGSHPVAKHLPLALDSTIVHSFEFNGSVYFVASDNRGQATLNRLHADCAGWTRANTFEVPSDADTAVPFRQNDQSYLFVHRSGG